MSYRHFLPSLLRLEFSTRHFNISELLREIVPHCKQYIQCSKTQTGIKYVMKNISFWIIYFNTHSKSAFVWIIHFITSHSRLLQRSQLLCLKLYTYHEKRGRNINNFIQNHATRMPVVIVTHELSCVSTQPNCGTVIKKYVKHSAIIRAKTGPFHARWRCYASLKFCPFTWPHKTFVFAGRWLWLTSRNILLWYSNFTGHYGYDMNHRCR